MGKTKICAIVMLLAIGGCKTSNSGVDSSVKSDEADTPNTHHPVKWYEDKARQIYGENPVYSNIIAEGDFFNITTRLKSKIILYLMVHNKKVRKQQNEFDKEKAAYALADERINACMLNSAGKGSSTVKRWVYCQVPLEVRLCNSVILKFTSEWQDLEKRHQVRMAGFNYCLSSTGGVNTEVNFLEEYREEQLLDGLLKLYGDIYLGTTIQLLDNEDSEVPAKPSVKAVKRWLSLVGSGPLETVKFPFVPGSDKPDPGNLNLISVAVYWLVYWKDLKEEQSVDINTFTAGSKPISMYRKVMMKFQGIKASVLACAEKIRAGSFSEGEAEDEMCSKDGLLQTYFKLGGLGKQ